LSSPPGPEAGCTFGPSNGACLAAALAHGAHGALHRDSRPEEFFEAIRAVAWGERWVGSGIPLRQAPELPLSTRERMVSLLVGGGNSNKEIAVALRISEATVKKHIGHVLKKLGLHDRLQLGICVIRYMPSFQTDGSRSPGRERPETL
jgi:DNA-binding NarL/FixJ family response regulator